MDSVVTTLFMLVLLAVVVIADLPCFLRDVTTLRGSKLEVHSRTNAIGLPTNISDVVGMREFSGNLHCDLHADSQRFFHGDYEPCSGWHLHGFESTSWSVDDDFYYDWIPSNRRNSDYLEIYSAGESRGFVKNLDSYIYDYNENIIYSVRLHSANVAIFHIIIKSERFSKGLQFVVNPSRPLSVSYQEKIFFDEGDSRLTEEIGDVHGSVSLLKKDPFYTVFLRKDGEGVCMWMKNTNHSTDCLYKFTDNYFPVFKVIVDRTVSSSDIIVSEDSEKKAMLIQGTNGYATISPFEVGPSGELCLSLRYTLKNGQSAKVQFVVEEPYRILSSTKLQGTGQVVSRQFSMVLPETYHKGKLNITFETESAGSFVLKSSRHCSASDRDVSVVEIAKEDENRYRQCCTVYRRKAEDVKYGFTTVCSSRLYNTFHGSNKKCHHGGHLINGWCLCLPGFTGPACEKVCPRGKFGADCWGVCVDDYECKGVSLAAPGLPLECARGFSGADCNETCAFGFYGPNCRLKCGQCLHGTCDRFSGSCAGPCKQGYTNRTCQYQLASIDRISIISTSFNTAEARVYVTQLSDEDLNFYPILKVLYKKEEDSSLPWGSVFIPLTSRIMNVTLYHLDYGKEYIINAALIHESGNFYLGPVWNEPKKLFSTDCNVGTFDKVDIVAEEERLSVSWKMTESKMHPCYLNGYTLEVFLPEMEAPIKSYARPDRNGTTIHATMPMYGTLRLRATYTTKDMEWTYLEFTTKEPIVETNNFEIVGKTTHSIDFLWSSSDNSGEDLVICMPTPILCDDRELQNVTQNVRVGHFSLLGLSPFTRYNCILDKRKLEATAMTQQDLPSASPNPHDNPTQVTNTTASIKWKNIDCLDVNGVPKGFRVELWRGNSILATAITLYAILETSLADLTPDTHYEAKVYVVNQLGWDVSHPLAIPFKTKSTTPNAVTNLVVYKRTRNDLWLRWTPPESFSGETVVVAYKVTASASGVPTQTSETPPVECSLWPEYVCHRLRLLVPDTEYTVEVQAKNNKVDSYGPSAVSKAVTREEDSDRPLNVRIKTRTATSVVLSWELPLMLNSNPNFFSVTLEQVDQHDNSRNPTEASEKKIFIIEDKSNYEVRFDQLNPATTYVVTISAGFRGQRAELSVNTPPVDPPTPPEPTVNDTVVPKLTVRGLKTHSASELLSGYLLLVTWNGTFAENLVGTDGDIAASVRSLFADRFIVVHEYPPNLREEVFTFASEPRVQGNFSYIENVRLQTNQKYGFALAAVSTYCGAHAVAVSPITFFPV